MRDVEIGTAMRTVRLRRRLRQADVAAAAGLSRGVVSLIERGHMDTVSLRAIRAAAAVLEMRVDVGLRWRGGALPRMINERHAAMHEAVAARLARLPGWVFRPEVSYSVYGERGVVDLVGWHEATGTLVIVELKTEIVDVQDLIASMDRRRRLAAAIGRSLGWQVRTVAVWVIVADSRTNRRHVARYRTVLRSAFPDGGRTMGAWLREPAGTVAALSFLTYANGRDVSREIAATRRVRRVSVPREGAGGRAA